jgi:hypothetical protein
MDGEIDPQEATAMIEAAFFERLADVLAASSSLFPDSGVEAAVRQRLANLERNVAHLIANEMDAANARFTLLAVAAFEVLSPVCGPQKSEAIVDDCLNRRLREWVLEGTRGMLDNTDDAFASLVAVSKEREASYFGPSFVFDRPIDDADTYVLDVKRCLFHEILVAVGHTHLQPLLCRFDLNWVDAIDAERHHLRFVRPVTFATGEVCRMCFVREENLSNRVDRAKTHP